jgi:hypothetical protein
MRWSSLGPADNENGRTVTFLADMVRTIKTQIFFVIIGDISMLQRRVLCGYEGHRWEIVEIGEHFTTQTPAYDCK